MAVTTYIYPPSAGITISGGATEAKQDVQITSLQLLDDVVSTTGSAAPGKSYQVSGTDGTNARVLKTDTSGELQIDVLSSALPTGAATESTQLNVNTNLNQINGKLVTVDTADVTITTALPAGTNNIGSITNITGTVSLPTGAATETTLSSLNGKVTAVNTGAVTISSALPAGSAVIGKVSIDQTTPGTTNKVDIGTNGTVAATQSGTWTVQPGNTANTTAWLVKEATTSSATLTNVNASASSVSLLASNSSRTGAAFFNDSTAVAYLKYGTTASTTSYTVQIQPGGYYELIATRVYNGAIDCIWSAANGAMRITELA